MASTPPPTITVFSAATADPYAVVIVGERARRVALEPGQDTIIGRAEECAISIDHASVSRRHARLRVDAAGASVEDLGSRNGTRLNGKPISGTVGVTSGDVLAVGDATLVLYLARRLLPARGGVSREIVERLEGELDRALRYHASVAVIVWEAAAPAETLLACLGDLLRRCDSVGAATGGELIGVFPELDGDQAEDLARRSLDLLRVADPGTRAGVAACPGEATDAATLLATARDALAAATDGVGRAEQTTRRIMMGDHTVLVADPGMVRLYNLLKRIAPSDLPVLLAGETGVGKELAARALHLWSRRSAGPFVAVNCAALPESLVESELFGHRRGAFSGADRDKAGYLESADGGTLLLDEVGDLPLAAQAKLLRAVDTREVTPVGQTQPVRVDVRFVAATNRDLATDVAEGRFRADLFYRLNAAVVVLPPLRDRPRDVPALARAFLTEARARLGRSVMRISGHATRHLLERRFPGNVRELRNTMAYAAAVTDDDVLEPWHLPAEAGAVPPAGELAPPVKFRPIADEVEELERRRMKEALAACGGNQSQAADLIGMPRRTFVTKLGKYDLR